MSGVFPDLDSLLARFRELGARRILCKPLAENDNSKQQIYLGGNFEVLRLLPYSEVRAEAGGARQNFKAALKLSRIDAAGHVAEAAGSQLILYPDYPEVRLSGFLRGCPIAPSGALRPVPKESRRFYNGPDGRFLFLAITDSNSILAYLALRDSRVAREVEQQQGRGSLAQSGVFLEVGIPGRGNARAELLSKLRQIHSAGWHESRRLNNAGVPIPYAAQNGGGYTLEALFGIRPNGESAPDFLGWELKAYGSSRVTLMTPEPDTGYYGKQGVEAFVRKYGHSRGDDVMYFTGMHRANERCNATNLTLTIRGFDAGKGKIVNVTGGIELLDDAGKVSAGWSFNDLIKHWGRKHASTAYVPYEKQATPPPKYRYLSPVQLGQGTDFSKYLSAIVAGHVVFDPGAKISEASSKKSRVKARSQFRIAIRKLDVLYYRLEFVDL